MIARPGLRALAATLCFAGLALIALADGRDAGFLFPILVGERWGYIDSTGAIVIRPRFESIVSAEREQRASLDQAGGTRLGPADLLLAPAVGPESTTALSVKFSGRWGVADRGGSLIGPRRFDTMGPFSEGLAPVRLGEYWGFADEVGRVAIGLRFQEVGRFTGGLCIVELDGWRGVIDRSGQFVVNPRFEAVADEDSVFRDNRAVVMQDGKKGYVRRSGTVAIPAVYDAAFRFSEGLAAVETEAGTGYIDTLGRTVIAPRFERGEPFDGGLACVLANGLYGLVDRTGAFVAKPVYEQIGTFAGRDRAPARRGDKLGTVDRRGRWRESPFVERFAIDDTLSIGRVAGRSGIVRRATGMLIQPLDWEEIGAFAEGLAPVRNRDTRYGFIDIRGGLVIAPRFDEVQRFRHGLCKAVAGDTVGYVDRGGSWAWCGRFAGAQGR